MKIAIVNDLTIAVEVLRRIVVSIPHYQVAWIARDGAEAVRKCAELTPDIVLMDLIMPVMDGVEATRRIMESHPCAILVVTATVSGNSSKVYEAMGYGALDAVNTPVLNQGLQSRDAQLLLSKIETVGRLVHKPPPPSAAAAAHAAAPHPTAFPPLLAIGASTGGPKAVETILSKLPKSFPAATVLVQHIDASFAPGLADWLNAKTPLDVQVAQEGAMPLPSIVYVAGTNDHLVLDSNGSFHYTPHPAELPYRPSVDVFFQSIPHLPPRSVLAVLLTGMGRDGAEGLLCLRRAGHLTLAQDEATSVVYGMPRAAAEIKAARQVLPIDALAALIASYWPVPAPLPNRP